MEKASSLFPSKCWRCAVGYAEGPGQMIFMVEQILGAGGVSAGLDVGFKSQRSHGLLRIEPNLNALIEF